MPVPVTATIEFFREQSYTVEVWYKQDPEGVFVLQTTGDSNRNHGACEYWDVYFVRGMEAPNFLFQDVPQNRDMYRVSSLGEFFPPCINTQLFPFVRLFIITVWNN